MKPTLRSDGRFMLTKQKNGIKKTFYDTTAKGCIAQAIAWNGSSTAGIVCKVSMDNWISSEISTRAKATQEQYKYMRKYIDPILAYTKVGKVLPVNCQTVINKMHKQGLSESSMKHARKVMHAFFEYERVMKKTITENPCHDIKIPRSKQTRERRSATPEELGIIWDRLYDTHYYNCFRFLLVTGLRPSEVCGIKIRDIDNAYIDINETRTRYDVSSGKTKNAHRRIYLSNIMKEIIEDQLNMLKEKYKRRPKYLFPNEDGHPSHSGLLTRAWSRIVPEVSDLTLYELRHTYVSLLYDKIPLKELQALIGHASSMDTSGTYAHVFRRSPVESSMIIDREFTKLINGKIDKGIDKV